MEYARKKKEYFFKIIVNQNLRWLSRVFPLKSLPVENSSFDLNSTFQPVENVYNSVNNSIFQGFGGWKTLT